MDFDFLNHVKEFKLYPKDMLCHSTELREVIKLQFRIFTLTAV